MPLNQIAAYYPLVRMAIHVPKVGYPRITAPFATSPFTVLLQRRDSFDLHA